MESRQQRTMAAFENVLAFLKEHPIKPEPPLLGRMRSSLQAMVRQLQAAAAGQVSRTRSMGDIAERLGARRLAMRKEMMALVRIARPLLKFAPDAELALRVPHARADTEAVAHAAMAMTKALAPHAEVLEDAGYEKGFFAEFSARARRLAEAAGDAERARNERGRLTADIASAVKEGMRLVMVIEGMVMRAFADQSGTLVYWRNQRRVSKRIGRPKQRMTRP